MNPRILSELQTILERPIEPGTVIEGLDSIQVVMILATLDDFHISATFDQLKACHTAGEIASLK